MAPRQRSSTNNNNETESSSLTTSSSGEGGAATTALLNDENNNNNEKTSQEKIDDAAALKRKKEIQTKAIDQHDLFNLFALPPVMAILFRRFGLDIFLIGITSDGRSTCSDRMFYEAWAATIIYFLADLLWVAYNPICVKSPGVIIKHHIFAIVYMFGPIYFPDFSCYLGPSMSVEINTIFLILRRVLYRRKEYVPKMITFLAECAFYISWIGIRLFVYPMVLVSFFIMMRDIIKETGTIFNLVFIFIPVHAFFCILNIKWSYDLFMPMIKKHIFGIIIDDKSAKRKKNDDGDAPSEGL